VPDRTSQLLISALSRAATEPAGLPLHPASRVQGLFPSTMAGKQAAQRSVADGYLRPNTVAAPVSVTTVSEPGSARAMKPAAETFVLTDNGLSFLLSQTSPRPILEDFVRVLEARHTQASTLLTIARQMLGELSAFRTMAERVLERIREPGYVWPPVESEDVAAPCPDYEALVLNLLVQHRKSTGSGEDCPLPELFRMAREAAPTLTVGGFHDTLRQLSDASRIYLHPWTGPLYDLPEPAYALLVGHVVAYYASIRVNAEIGKLTAD
jgi:hypothetical protein